jgi:hypothetical protein
VPVVVGGGVPPPAGGAVGDSPLHAANKNRSASSAIHDFCCLNAFMSAPWQPGRGVNRNA